MFDLQRREFIGLLGVAAAWPLAARAQQSAKVPTVGFLGPNTRPAAGEWVAEFVQGLRGLGWIDGRNVAIEYRWAEGREELFSEIATEFARRKVDVIVTSGTPAVMASMHATSVIPIVFATAGDPVGNKLVASLLDRAATSLACRSNRQTLRASDSNFCTRSSPVSAAWR